MKNILLYGDSLFWGVDAVHRGRHKHQDQVGVLCQQALGGEFYVVTEGLRGRTLFGENGAFPERNGLDQFGPIFASHLPLDMVVIMLGTNDLNSKTLHKPEGVKGALEAYYEKMQFWCTFMQYKVPKVLLIAPPAIDQESLDTFRELFEDSDQLVVLWNEALREYAAEHDCSFIDASRVIVSKNTDGIHIDAEENKKLAVTITEVIKKELSS